MPLGWIEGVRASTNLANAHETGIPPMPRRSVATGCMQKVGIEDENLGSGFTRSDWPGEVYQVQVGIKRP